MLVYQNTFIGQGRLMRPASNVHFVNNLFLGDGYVDPVFTLSTYTNYSTSDYNGFRPNPVSRMRSEWSSPPFEVATDYEHDPVVRHFKSLKEYSDATRQEQHSILIDYDIFVNVRVPDKRRPATSLQTGGLRLPIEAGLAPRRCGRRFFLRSPTISPGQRPTSAHTNWNARYRTTVPEISSLAPGPNRQRPSGGKTPSARHWPRVRDAVPGC